MKHVKVYELFIGDRNLDKKFSELKTEFEKFNKDVRLSLIEKDIFKTFLKYIKKAISLFTKIKNGAGYSLNLLKEVYKFIYENTLVLDEMPSISSFYIDDVRNIYKFLNDWNDYIEEISLVHSFPERRFKFTKEIPRD